MTNRLRANREAVVSLVLGAGLAAMPFVAHLLDNPFIVTLATKVAILALAGVGLNLALGYGGLVSFGHAAFFGLGGYAAGILASAALNYEPLMTWPFGMPGTTLMPIIWLVAMAASAIAALVIGALSLRTGGVYFIMITLAFAQMLYYVAVSLDRYGADDGMTIYQRSEFDGIINLSNKISFYYLCFGLLLATIYLTWRIVNSRFGMVIQGSRSNDRRMRAIGFPTYRYRLVVFMIAGTICGLSGALLANQTDFISPAVMYWTRSGDLIVMVVLGGMGTPFGPVIGAVALLLLEEWLSGVTEYWQIILGPMLLLVVLFARGGIEGLLAGASRG